MKKKKVKRKLLKLCSLGLLGITVCTPVIAQQINYQANPRTGALQALTIAGDPQGMNWLVVNIRGLKRTMDGDWDILLR